MSRTKSIIPFAGLATSERSGEVANPAGAAPTVSHPPAPDSEVIARPRRRSFTAEYKRSILDQADAAQDSGAIGALLRREGLYSSRLTAWRRQRQKGEIAMLSQPRSAAPRWSSVLWSRRTGACSRSISTMSEG